MSVNSIYLAKREVEISAKICILKDLIQQIEHKIGYLKQEKIRIVKEWESELCCSRGGVECEREQTPTICLEAVKENGDALQHVNKKIFEKK